MNIFLHDSSSLSAAGVRRTVAILTLVTAATCCAILIALALHLPAWFV
jgi:hypothetical protein